LRVLAALVLVAAVAAGGALWAWGQYVESPVGPLDTKIAFDVTPGMGFFALSERLGSIGLVAHPELLRLYVKLRPPEEPLKVGEYELSGAMTPAALIARVTSGKVIQYPITVPEGYTAVQIADVIEAAGFASAERVMAVARDVRFIGSLDIPSERIEGYLLPETYHFPKGTVAADILKAMVDAFNDAWTTKMDLRADELGMTKHEIVTLASIVEKETGVASERPHIAGVFHNRLKKRMRLQADPTVIYGIADFDGNLTRAHLRQETPYNTYVIRGLPPGPIANPGIKAIEAALWPMATDDLYFVATGDGRHVFSPTLAEHERNVDKYQRMRRTAERKEP